MDIIVLIFLSIKIGRLAVTKGLSKKHWILYTVLAWLGGEFLGVIMAIAMFGTKDLFPMVTIGLFAGFGGYLIIKYNLEKKPDYFDDEIDKIGVDDLRPPDK